MSSCNLQPLYEETIGNFRLIQYFDGDIGIEPSDEYIEDMKDYIEGNRDDCPQLLIVGDQEMFDLMIWLLRAYPYTAYMWRNEPDTVIGLNDDFIYQHYKTVDDLLGDEDDESGEDL